MALGAFDRLRLRADSTSDFDRSAGIFRVEGPPRYTRASLVRKGGHNGAQIRVRWGVAFTVVIDHGLSALSLL